MTSGIKSVLQFRVTRTMLKVIVDGGSDAATATTIAMEIPEHYEHPIVQLVYDATAAAAAAVSSSSGSSQAQSWTASAAAEIANFPPRVTGPEYGTKFINKVHIPQCILACKACREPRESVACITL
jgi:xanthine/uracil permease